MRLSSLFSILVVLGPGMLVAAGTRVPPQGSVRVPVRVTASIPLIAAVEGPDQVELAPGEVAHIRVCVLANVPWLLRIHSPNACAQETVPLSGPPGGSTVNTRELDITCSPDASGRQTIALIYTLMPR